MANRMTLTKVLSLTVLMGLPLTGVAKGQMAIPDEREERPAARQPQPRPAAPEETVSFGIFAEPMELSTLIDFVGDSLGINIVVKGSPEGEVVFNAPIEVPKSRLIDLLDAMLDQYGFTVTFEPATQFYVVQPTSEVKPVFGDQLATTKIIATPNIKPSLLVPALQSTLGGPSTGAGGAGNAGTNNAIQAVDELGVLIINATSRDIRRIEGMVEALITIDKDQQYIRFELDHLAAPIALNRVVGLAGGSTSTGQTLNLQQGGRNNQGGNQGIVSLAGGSLTNLGERITIDPQGNALIFKGTQNEIDRVRQLLEMIDVPNTLEPKNYFAGSSATQIADIAKRRGLGEVIQIEDETNQFNGFGNFNQQNNQFNTSSDEGQGGPVMVVDPTRGNIIYYGTPEQQAQLSALLDELKTEDERIVIREYQLNHTDALTITDLLTGIITGETQTGSSALLDGASGRTNTRFINQFGFPVDGESGAFDPDKITVIADEFSNQVVIKAPIKQQEDLERLIGRLDMQRAQVYIEALIVSVTDNEDITVAFESQITAGQYSYGTNFGLSSRDNFLDPKSVTSSLGGLTQAVIMSDYVPIIVNATQTNSDVRILSQPQLLVNDNEESSIVSIEEQPYTEVSQGTNGGQNVVGFAGTVEAGTTLTVTPSISKAGFIRLEYYVELSNFIGTGSDGIPPPTTRRTVDGSATVPSNATIVIGGITVDDVRDTVLKVPLLGDIPLVGELFKRTNNVNNSSKLYVFLTPRIMADPNFNDLKLFSKGPQSEMKIDDDLPDLEPAVIDAPGTEFFQSELPDLKPDDSVGGAPPAMEPEFVEVSEVSGS
ncbi:MAG: secretin N-terminal domain-containing protein [Phycisphaerales bacterium JB047]